MSKSYVKSHDSVVVDFVALLLSFARAKYTICVALFLPLGPAALRALGRGGELTDLEEE